MTDGVVRGEGEAAVAGGVRSACGFRRSSWLQRGRIALVVHANDELMLRTRVCHRSFSRNPARLVPMYFGGTKTRRPEGSHPPAFERSDDKPRGRPASTSNLPLPITSGKRGTAVPAAGFEPARVCAQTLAERPRLPFPPRRHRAVADHDRASTPSRGVPQVLPSRGASMTGAAREPSSIPCGTAPYSCRVCHTGCLSRGVRAWRRRSRRGGGGHG